MRFHDWSASNRFSWGEFDCILEIAEWLRLSCGIDAASHWKGKYTNEIELNALTEPLGGFEAVVRSEAARLGLEETDGPLTGDVALVVVQGQEKPMGAILMPSGRWRIKAEDRIVMTRGVTVIVAWKLPCRPSLPQS